MTNEYFNQIVAANVKGVDVLLIPGFEYLLIVPRTKNGKYFDVIDLEENEAVATKVSEFDAKKFAACFVAAKVEEAARIAAAEKAWADAVAAEDAADAHYADLQPSLF